MKKNLLLLFCTVSIFVFSQDYHFDYKCYDDETQLKGAYKGDKRTNIIYFNSEINDILAYDYFFSQEPKRSLQIYDFKHRKRLFFTINKNSDFSSLKFKKILPIEVYPDEIKIDRVDVENLQEDLWLIRAFPTKESTHANLELKILLKKSNFPMRGIRFMDLTSNIHYKIYEGLALKLDSPNYRIVNVTTDYKNGVIMNNDLSKCEKINLKFLSGQKSN